MLLSDHRCSLIQRQRQLLQFGGHGRGADFVGQGGSPVQQGQRFLGAECVYWDTCPELRYRLPGHGDQDPGRPCDRNERPHQTRILHAIEHQQTMAPVSFQPVPDRLARVGCARPGTADRQPRRFWPLWPAPPARSRCPGRLTHAISRQPSASLARAYAAASWVLPTPQVPVSTTDGLWLIRFSCAIRASLGWKPGRRAGISPTTTWSFVVVRAGGSMAYGSLVPTAG